MRIMLGRRDGDARLQHQVRRHTEAMCGAALNEFAMEIGSPEEVTCEACAVAWVAERLRVVAIGDP